MFLFAGSVVERIKWPSSGLELAGCAVANLPPPRSDQWVTCSTSGLVALIVDIFYVSDSFCVSDLFYISDSFYVSYLCYVLDLWYMWWTCVICIGVIVVFVNYIFVIITACNVRVLWYIFVIFVTKNRGNRNKKNWSLCRVHKPKHSAKWPAQVSSAASLPSAWVQHSAK